VAISSTLSTVSYTGNASTVTAYTITFRYDAATWLLVEQEDADGIRTTLTNGVDFTLGGDGAATTGTLVTTVAVPATDKLIITRVTPGTQSLALSLNAPLPTPDLEAGLDKLVMQAQDQARLHTQHITAPAGETLATLPTASVRASQGLAFDASGDPTTDEVYSAAEKTKLAGFLEGDTLITGTELLYGTGGPDPSLGAETNMYLDDASGVLYRKTTGTWAAIYTPSNNIIHLVASTPLNTFGSDGDVALVIEGEVVVSLLEKAAGTWTVAATWYHAAHPNEVALVDHFLGGNVNTTVFPAVVGELNWYAQELVGTGGFVRSGATIASSTPYHPTIGSIDLSPGSSIGDSVAICFDNGAASGNTFRVNALLNLNGFYLEWEFKMSGLLADIWFGLMDVPNAAAAAPTRFVGVKHEIGETNFQFEDLNSASSNQEDSGVAADTDWHTFRLEHDGTDWLMSLDGGAQTVVTRQVTATVTVGVWITNGSAAANRVYLDTFRLYGTK
jgi:hypothetical protein